MDDTDLPTFTAAVCTRNGARPHAECLDALAAPDYPAARLDVLVVDNAPENDDARVLADRYPSIRYVVEPRPGLDWARNLAIAEARGEIIAYTDDDVSVDPGWAAAIGRLFAAHSAIARSPGSSSPDETDVESQRLFEQYGGFGRGFEREYFRVEQRRARRQRDGTRAPDASAPAPTWRSGEACSTGSGRSIPPWTWAPPPTVAATWRCSSAC